MTLHLEHEIDLVSDPEVMRYLGNGKPATREQVVQAHRERLAVGGLVPGLGFWAGFHGQEFVGLWFLQPPARPDQGPVEGQAELGYRLLRRHWREGLASGGARELLRHGFEDLRLPRIFAETMAVNVASRATMAAIGMQHVRTFERDFDEPLPGTEHGEVEYAITRKQWSERGEHSAEMSFSIELIVWRDTPIAVSCPGPAPAGSATPAPGSSPSPVSSAGLTTTAGQAAPAIVARPGRHDDRREPAD